MAAPKSKRSAKAKPKRVSVKAQKAKFKKFLHSKGHFSLFGHWVIPHSKFRLYSFGSKKCTIVVPTVGWIRDQATPFTCTDAGGEHPVIQAFFR